MIDSFELGEGDVDLASDFEDWRDHVDIFTDECEGDGFDCSGGVGDIVALGAVASGEGAGE